MQYLKYHKLLILLLLCCIARVNQYCDGAFYSCPVAHHELKTRSQQGSEYYETIYLAKINRFKNNIKKNIRSHFPSPHSELLLGITLGIDALDKVSTFNDVLTETGTIHVVVVSGYNISLVSKFLLQFFGTKYKLKNLILTQFGTLIYAVVSGFEPPVIRAWIMGLIVTLGSYYGRSVEMSEVLLFSVISMVLINPVFLYSLSFQLSVLATLGLLLYSSSIEKRISAIYYKWVIAKPLQKNPHQKLPLLLQDLSASLAALVLVWPLISCKFGRVSLISPVVNCLTLWTIPLATVLGSLFLPFSALSNVFTYVFKLIIYVPLDIFVNVVTIFAKLPYASVPYEIPLSFLFFYYAFFFALPFLKFIKGGRFRGES